MARRSARITVARAYDLPSPDGAYRVLVDRLWPRGVSKETLALDAWRKDLAPSDALRRWFNHLPERWPEFQVRYARELEEQTESLQELLAISRRQPLLLIYAARDEAHNNAVALREILLGLPAAKSPPAIKQKPDQPRGATRKSSAAPSGRSGRKQANPE